MRCLLWIRLRPVSYTHLDVYKRQKTDSVKLPVLFFSRVARNNPDRKKGASDMEQKENQVLLKKKVPNVELKNEEIKNAELQNTESKIEKTENKERKKDESKKEQLDEQELIRESGQISLSDSRWHQKDVYKRQILPYQRNRIFRYPV